MDIFRAVAIILVVFGHNYPFPGATWFVNYFPLTSYRMALFLFASGYFFKDLTWKDYPSFFWRKTKGLAVPLIGWNIVYACIVSVLSARQLTDYLPSVAEIWTFNNLFVEPFVTGHQYFLNLATWFVGMLYPALLVYGIFNILFAKKVSDHILLIVYAFIAFGGLSLHSLPQSSNYWYVPLRICYALFFINFGKYYRQYIEPYIERVSSWILIPACLLFSYLSVSLGGKVPYQLVWINYGGQVFLPIFMAIAGILLWMRLTRIIEKYVIPNKLEQVISAATWDLMTHHLFVKVIIGWILIHWAIEPDLLGAFRYSIWFTPKTVDYWMMVLLQITLPVLWYLLFDFVKKSLHKLAHLKKKQ